MMLFKYNYYELPARNDGSKDLKVQDGKKKFVPEFIAGSTLDLADQIELESDNAVNNNIMMVVTYRKSRPKKVVLPPPKSVLHCRAHGVVGASRSNTAGFGTSAVASRGGGYPI